MRKFTVLLLLCFTLFSPFYAQEFRGQAAGQVVDGGEWVYLNEKSQIPELVRFETDKAVALGNFDNWMNEYLQLTPGTDFRVTQVETDQIGMTHYRYQQYKDDFPVFAGTYIAHSRDAMVEVANGKVYLPSGNANIVVQEKDAFQLALNYVGAETYRWELFHEEALLRYLKENDKVTWKPTGFLIWVPVGGIFEDENYRLAWSFDIYSASPLGRSDVYVDAQSGEIIWQHEKIHTKDVTAVAVTKYSGIREIIVDSVNNTLYRLREVGRGGGVRTMNKRTKTNKGSAVDFEDNDNYWNNFNAAQDEVGTDSHWGSEMTWDYLWFEHGRNSFDNAGAEMLSFVHHGNGVSNAFFDGSSANFGDGGGTRPWNPLDVVAHEYGHGVTGNSAGLVYQNEPGGLNESFSDILGNLVERYAKAIDFDWAVAEDVTGAGNGIRNMADPQEFGDPDTYGGKDWFIGAGDNGGVHTNSGVQNHWFYLLVEGGSGTNDVGGVYSVNGIGMSKAGKIAIRNLTSYLTQSSQYEDARRFAIQSAIDLYGTCSTEMIATMDAWHAVGVGSPYAAVVNADFTFDKSKFCTYPAEVEFKDQSAGAVGYWWSFGDLGISNAVNPTHTYSAVGQFTVTLIVTACDGSKDTMRMDKLIQIDPTQPCQIFMPANATDSIDGCEGTLYDTGGPNSDYSNNSVSRVKIAPVGALSVSLNFKSFHFATAGDVLSVYDGPDDSYPLIGHYNGTTLPNGGNITSSGPALYLVESTNGFQSFPGFELDWSCAVAVDDPIDAHDIQVYPNPTQGRVNIEWGTFGEQVEEIRVLDLMGKIVLHEIITDYATKATSIDLGQFSAGVYNLRIKTSSGMKMKKIVVQ